jgi:glycosyltransferase involved in cell wall biosynthesis
LLGKICAQIYNKRKKLAFSDVAIEYSHKYTCPLMPKIQSEQEYDLAISFLTPHYFVAQKVRAKKKIAWIHTDYSKIKINVPSELAMWDAYDHIASISDMVTEGFCGVFPQLRDKILLIKNILPKTLVVNQAQSGIKEEEMPSKGIRLLSIGRFCTAKNFDNIPQICANLVSVGLDVYWYIIGFGTDEQLILQNIREAGMERRVIVLGKKENPYPYIATCDLYVQPSRFEGNCVTVREAQMLGKPVVITRYATSASQLEDGVDGIIVPMDNEGCAQGIAMLLRDKERMQELIATCRQRDYSNAEEAEKLYELLERE